MREEKRMEYLKEKRVILQQRMEKSRKKVKTKTGKII